MFTRTFATVKFDFLKKVWRRPTIEMTRHFIRRPFPVRTAVPIVSFTFDDFPRSALLRAAPILKRYGVRGTYYASLGLMGTQGPPGAMFQAEDLGELVQQGHELGC